MSRAPKGIDQDEWDSLSRREQDAYVKIHKDAEKYRNPLESSGGVRPAPAQAPMPPMPPIPMEGGFLPALGVAAGAYTGAQQFQGLNNVAKGKDPTMIQHAAMLPITGGFEFLAGPLGNTFGFGQKSVREHQAGATKGLLSASQDPTYQAYVQGMRKQFETGPKDPSKPFHGEYGSWDEYKKAGLDASDLTGVLGNIQAGGEQWAKLDQAQRQAITQQAIDKDLYYSSKGDVKVNDQNAFKQIMDEYLKGNV